jgi:uncharacterized protein
MVSRIWRALFGSAAPALPAPPPQPAEPIPAPIPAPILAEVSTAPAAPAVASASPSPEVKISRELDEAAMSKLLDWLTVGSVDRRNPFDPRTLNPPPGVAAGAGMAMDAAPVVDIAGWAHGGLAGFANREGFIGYPELAILALRPEYRSPVEIIATEATRKWIKFESAGNSEKTAKIRKIEDEFKRLKVQDVFKTASEHDGFFGRGHIYIDTGDTEDPVELKRPLGDGTNELSRLKIGPGSIKELLNVEPVWVWPNIYNSIQPLSSKWYNPEVWYCMSTEVHKSRLLTFISREVPDLLKPAYMFGGQSLTQQLMPVVENWLSTRRAVGDIVKKFSHNVVKANLTEALNSGNSEQLFRRIAVFTKLKNNSGTMLLDKDTEDFLNVSVPLGGLSELQAQAQEHMASLSRIPIIKLLGIQPAGLNASSAGELRAFADFIHSYQESFFRPNLERILNLVQCSLFGEVDPDIKLEFDFLTEELTDGERAQASQQVTAGVSNAFEAGVIDRSTALREIKAQLESLGIASAITDEMIAEAAEGPPTPSPEELKAEAMMVKAEQTLVTH